MIVYSEGGWAKDAVENQELRRPPTQLGSDGSRNLWIRRRRAGGGAEPKGKPGPQEVNR